jgi:alpha-beta hydrolase superfamily lysophospholipase
VVIAPGAGAVGLDYLNIHDQISQFTTSVIYDRAGTGWSDEVKLPRSAAEVSDELRSLLHTAGVPAPYLLVGHSLGGLYIRRYALLIQMKYLPSFSGPRSRGLLLHESKLAAIRSSS